MATIKDVARRSGVSTTTVSFVLNGTGSVGADARERVLQAARELGYTPNPLARAMITRRTLSLGVLVNTASTFTSANMLDGIEEAARASGYEIFLALHRDDAETALGALRDLMNRRVDAIVAVFAKADEHPEVIASLPAADVPYVVAFYQASEDDAPIDNVVADQEQGGYLAARHLLEQGRRRLAFAGGARTRNATRKRLAGFLRACAEAGADPLPEHILFHEYSVEAGQGMGEKLLATPTLPNGILGGDDHLAAGLLRAFRRGGVRVPADIAVVGFNDSEIAECCDPALTSVRMPLNEIGALCVRQAIARLESPNTWQPQSTVLPCTLTVRESA
jgi:LacI family transcriptional regulator